MVQGLLRRISWGEPQLLALWLGPGERGRPLGWKSGVTRRGASPSLPLPVCLGALLGGVTDKRPRALATVLCLLGAAFGGLGASGEGRAGMGRTATGSPGRRRQRRRLRGRRRRRLAPRQRKSPASGRRRARLRRKEPCSKSLGQAQPAALDRNRCVDYQDPVRAGPPHPPAAPRARWDTWWSPKPHPSFGVPVKCTLLRRVLCTF